MRHSFGQRTAILAIVIVIPQASRSDQGNRRTTPVWSNTGVEIATNPSFTVLSFRAKCCARTASTTAWVLADDRGLLRAAFSTRSFSRTPAVARLAAYAVVNRPTGETTDNAPTNAHRPYCPCVIDHLPLTSRLHILRRMTFCNITLSSDRSATSFFSLPFSSSSGPRS